MWIYKITNIQNNKIYIGQTIRPVQQRINRHFNDALNHVIDTHFSRAIRLYGKDSFTWEIIDTANTQEELNIKEKKWIDYYNSVNDGYNETNAIYKCGGNTYQSKTEDEMKIITKKISESKKGGKNPMARKIKLINIQTKEEKIFDTIISCAQYIGIKKGKTSITQRLNGSVIFPYRNKYMFEYYNE